MNNPINLNEIPKKKEYTGYLWVSDSDQPTVLSDSKLESLNLLSSLFGTITYDEINDSSNPFIIEGKLFCKEANKSYSIKYVDGKHIVIEYDLNLVPDKWAKLEEEDLKKFIPNRIAASKIVFVQYWGPHEEKDEFCQNMQVLQPVAFVYVGFEYESKVKYKVKGGIIICQ